MQPLSEAIKEYLSQRCDTKLEKFEKEAIKRIKKAEEKNDDTTALSEQIRTEREKLKNYFDPSNWIEDAAKRATQIQLVTHAIKFMHSDAKGSSFNSIPKPSSNDRISTSTLDSAVIDVVGNAAALDVAGVLLLDNGKNSLWQEIADGNDDSLKPYAKNIEQLSYWMNSLSKTLTSTNTTTHTLAKQTYFPVRNGYHLISPLHPTSLIHAIDEQIRHVRFSEELKKVRAARRDNVAAEADYVAYPNTAFIKHGGSKPQNISLLNSRRRGLTYLLNSQPPAWNTKLRAPISGKRAFWKANEIRSRRSIKELRNFLSKVQNYNNKLIRDTVTALVSRVVDDFIQLTTDIRQLDTPGWSIDSNLPLDEQIMLDPYRIKTEPQDSAFYQMHETKSWPGEISTKFGLWLNNKLKGMRDKNGKKLRDLGETEANIWGGKLDDALKQLSFDLELLE